ncbi:MAG: hypothetical protein ACRDFQ_09985 [Anaerolineales bacterium]
MKRQNELIGFLFDGKTGRLSEELYQWIQASPRFNTFVEDYRDKIRKKIRVASEPEGLLDIRAELDVARGLLGDRRLKVEYELNANSKRRVPDFAVTYRENLIFHIEVSRMQASKNADAGRTAERIVRILLEKLGQMQPGAPNLLVIHTKEQAAQSVDLGKLMQQVKNRADKKDIPFYARSRYDGPSAFYKDFLHLNGILLWAPGADPWVNKQARPSLDAKVVRLVHSLVPA